MVEGPDNCATELIEPSENGFIASSTEPRELSASILNVHRGGERLGERTVAWYRAHAEDVSLEGSLAAILELYRASLRDVGSHEKFRFR